MNDNLLDDIEVSSAPRRRALLPGWVRFFCWFFIVTFVLSALVVVLVVTLFPHLQTLLFKEGTPAIIKWMLSILPPLAAVLLWAEYRKAIVYALMAGGATIVGSGYDVYNSIQLLSEQEDIVGSIAQLVIALTCIVVSVFFIQKMQAIRSEWEAIP